MKGVKDYAIVTAIAVAVAMGVTFLNNRGSLPFLIPSVETPTPPAANQ